MPYFESKTRSGQILKILVDTGSNKNYIQPHLIPNPIPNEQPFYANSIGGKVKITHHTIANLFGIEDCKVKFFIMPTLKSFHGILGNDSLKDLSAVIHAKNSYMIIRGKIKIKIKQQIAQSINAIDIRTNHMNSEQKEKIKSIVTKYPKLFAEPNEKLSTLKPIHIQCHSRKK